MMHRRELSARPLTGKRVGVLAGPEFSDFQAYYLNLYLSELGARVCNLVIGWPEVGGKMTRPATSGTVQGTFGLRLDPIPTMAHGDRYTSIVFRDQSELTAESAGELDALIVLGGHSADLLRVEPAVTGFVADAWEGGVLVGPLECGQMVLMSAGIIDGHRVTGYWVVRPFLSRLGTFVDEPVVVDGNLIAGRDSDPLLASCVLWSAASRRTGRIRPPMLGVQAVMGNFSMSLPIRELGDTRYPVVPFELSLDDFDAVMTPGAFCPWNCLDEGSPVELCRRAAEAGNVVAAICHGPLVLAAADLIGGAASPASPHAGTT